MSDGPTAAELAAAAAGADAIDVDELASRRKRKTTSRYAVTWDKARKPHKPVLPKPPEPGDLSGQCSWTTNVLHLDEAHPVTRAVHQGLSGALGHVVIERLDAPEIRFEPASKISSSQKLADELVWQLLPGDGDPYPWSNAQATTIARMIWLLCGTVKTATTKAETAHIVSTFIDAAAQQEGHTHGNAAQRAEMAFLLRPSEGAPCYGTDVDTGELVVRVSDLQRAARDIVGSSVPYGWLDARMDSLGWQRIRLDGRALPNGSAKRGQHIRADVYRGFLTDA